MGQTAPTIKAVLYTKDECSLCDRIKDQLIDLSKRFPHHLLEVDITRDETLWTRYRYEIPVVEIGDAVLKAPISRSDLIQALSQAISC